MLDSGKRAHTFGDGGRLGTREARCRHGGKDVFHVVRTGQGDVREFENGFLSSLAPKQDFAFLEEGTLYNALLAAEPKELRFGGSVWRCAWVIRVQDGAIGFSLVLEDSRFGCAVTFESVMAVQMIGREIQ